MQFIHPDLVHIIETADPIAIAVGLGLFVLAWVLGSLAWFEYISAR